MALVDELRQLCGVASDQYTLDGDVYWTDDQLTERLLRRRRWLVALDLSTVETDDEDPDDVLRAQVVGLLGVIDPADEGTIADADGIEVTDWTVTEGGLVVFGPAAEGEMPLFWTGYAYDIHGAAADVLEACAAAMSTAYDVSMDGQSLSRSQIAENYRKQAERQRALGTGGADGPLRSIPTRADL